MKNLLKFTTLCGLILTLVGCGSGKKSVDTFPPTDGDFVKNSGGRGTAQVWGVHFAVASPVGNFAGSEFDGMLHSDPEQTDARILITIGDDVKIRLEKVPGSSITFELNGKKHGTLEVGDTVVIDADRNVKLNDTSKPPEAPAP